MSQKVPPKQLGATLRADYKARIKEAQRAMRIAVQLHGHRVVVLVIESISPEPTDIGTYKRTRYIEDTDEGVIIYNNSPHAAVLEGGRRKGAKPPPVKVIAEWVFHKGIADRKDARGIAFAIARSIAKKGTPGKWIFKKAWKLLDPLVLEAVAQSANTRPPVKPRPR